jgi:hypothetical protein
MFVGNASVFAPAFHPCCVFILGASRFAPVPRADANPTAGPEKLLALLLSRSSIGSKAKPGKNADARTRNSSYKGARPSPLECALAKKGEGGALLRI